MIKDYNVTFKCDEAPIKSDSAEDNTGTGVHIGASRQIGLNRHCEAVTYGLM